MTQKELFDILAKIGVPDPRTETLLILESLFGVSPSSAMADRDRDFSSPDLDSLINRRGQGEPLQYIFGEWEFMGKKFYVSPSCLIPRPDTEILVEKAIEIIKNRTLCAVFKPAAPACQEADKGKKDASPTQIQGENEKKEQVSDYKIADLCTGSGCIGLSLLMYTNAQSVTLLDISSDALEMAQKNSARHGLSDKCRFILGDITKDMPKEQFDLIVSNPPYIPSRDVDALSPEVQREPRLALDGGEDGLDIIRYLIGDCLDRHLKPGGAMLIEFGFDQGEIMDTLLAQKRDTGSIQSYEILYDYGKNPRVALIRK